MHYHPSSDDLFRIITQISRFLREFSDFETYYTPEFRHPKIVGNEKELNDIGILGELRNLALCEEEEEPVKCDQNSEELVPESSNSDEIVKPKKKQKESPVQSGNQPCPSGQSSPQGNEVNPKQTKKCVTVKENAKTPKKQSRVQQLNV